MPDKDEGTGLSPLARQIMARMGIAPPVRAEETITVVGKNPDRSFPVFKDWWDAPHRGQASEILLGDKTKHPTGVYKNDELAEKLKGLRENPLDKETRTKYPVLGEAWDTVSANHPHMARYVRNLRVKDEPKSGVNGSMGWDAFFGGPDVTVNVGLDKDKAAIMDTLRHELTHVGQQLNWPTYEQNDKNNFSQASYMDRIGEQQAFDLTDELRLKEGRHKPPTMIHSKNDGPTIMKSSKSDVGLYESLLKRLGLGK